MLRDVDTGSFADPGRLTLAGYLRDHWLRHQESRVRARTLDGYRQHLERHVIPRIGAVRMAKLRPAQVQLVLATMATARRAPRTRLHAYRVLSESLRQAVRWQLLAANPAAAVQPPRPDRPETAAVGPDLANEILDRTRGTAYEIPVAVDLWTGLRLGELLALRWSDVDLEQAIIRVTASLQEIQTPEGHREPRFVEPKTGQSRRTVSLPAFALEALRQQRREQNERRLLAGPAWQDLGLVFDRGDGGPLRPTVFSNGWGRLAGKLGFPLVRFHDLRHAHATLMLTRGVHPKVVADRLGQSTISITLDTYSHVIPALQSEAAAVLDQIVASSSGVKVATGPGNEG